MNKDLMFSSVSCEWETPQDFFDKLNTVYHFDLDVCATPESAKCSNFFTPEQDGLTQTWKGRCWMNPPYGRTIGKWVQKAYESVRGGCRYCCLFASCQNGHSLVARLCHEGRSRICAWEAEIRRMRKPGAVSIGCMYL